MCTVSFIPLPDKGFIFTSNRDENPGRKTIPPKKIVFNNHTILAPIDDEKGGTWIATNETNKVVCILNGAFVKHKRILPYRKSRGFMTLEAFNAPSLKSYALTVILDNIEPFTLILIENNELTELVWDGNKKYIKQLEFNTTHLWSSATLYTPEKHQEKLAYFNQNVAEKTVTPENILKIHGKETKSPFILDLDYVKTVSITQLVHLNGNTTINYTPIIKTVSNFAYKNS